MTGSGVAPLRVALTADDPDSDEVRAILAQLATMGGVQASPVSLEAAADSTADVVWIHGVRPIALEALGGAGPGLLLRGRLLLTAGAAVLPSAAGLDPAAPNEVGLNRWPSGPDEDGEPPLRGHASHRGHPLFQGLGRAPLTRGPGTGELATAAVYVLPSWPVTGRVIAVERTRTAVRRDRATIWEYAGDAGRTLCIGAHLDLREKDPGLGRAAAQLALNALRRSRERSAAEAEEAMSTWPRPEAVAREDRALPMPELPLLEEPLGSVDFRLRTAREPRDDAPFHVAGRRACVAGGAARGIDEVRVHPVAIARGLSLRGAEPENITTTPVGVERRLRTPEAIILERVVVPREAPACVVEWLSRTRSTVVELGWTCDLALDGPYADTVSGPLAWRRAARGVVVGRPAGDRAVFAFSAVPESLVVEDASGDGVARLRVRARLRLPARTPVRLALAGGAGDAVVRRALAAADRSSAITSGRHGRAERIMSEALSLEGADPETVQAVEWAKHRLESCLVEAPGVGRCLVSGYGRSVEFEGPAAVEGALAALASGEFGTGRDVLEFLGRHQDPAGRVLHTCSTTGVARHDDARATPLYLLLAARYLAWTGDFAGLRAEWPRVMRAYEAALAGAGTDTSGGVLPGALAELAEAAESVGERGAAVELRAEASERRGAVWTTRLGRSPLTAVVQTVLGAEPDAARGRLVLRPDPPAGWARFRVAGLPLGDARVSVSYRRSGSSHTFRLLQVRGAAPAQVVLEPRLPGRRLAGARVDGVVAELDPRAEEGQIITPVQLVMDHERTVVLDIDPMEENAGRVS